MSLARLRTTVDRRHRSRLHELAVIGRTLAVQRKADAARRLLDRWRTQCTAPALSVSGGKDSTTLLLLAREIDPALPAYRADGPLRLQYTDRAAHVARLALASGGPWVVCPYDWDVAAWLAGDQTYQSGHKRRALRTAMQRAGVDGVALGLRAAESRGRSASARTHGTLYRAAGWRLTCTPLVGWTAREVLGYALARDLVPTNPVYERTHLAPDPEHLRDGSWIPRVTPDAHGYRVWLAYHYPEHVADYDRAWVVTGGGI